MKITTPTLVAALGLSLAVASSASASSASAWPADGAAIVRVGQQVDSVISVAAKKVKKSGTQTAAKPACAVDQTRSNRTGNCRPLTSEEK